MGSIQNNHTYLSQIKGDTKLSDLRMTHRYILSFKDENTVSLKRNRIGDMLRNWFAKWFLSCNRNGTLRDVHAGIINRLISINAQGGANGISADEVGRLSPDYLGQVIDLAQGDEKIINAVINHCNVNDQLLAKIASDPNSTSETLNKIYDYPNAGQAVLSAVTSHSNYSPGRNLVGGKGFFLYRMKQAGLPVPDFRCVDTGVGSAIENHKPDSDTIQQHFPDSSYTCIADIKKDLCTKPSEERKKGLEHLAQLLESNAFYQDISQTGSAEIIRALYRQVTGDSQGRQGRQVPVIARSSGVTEDRYGDARAGKYDSHVKGQEDIVRTYLKVIASGYRSNASSEGIIADAMPVVLQRCVDCRLGGVAMSYASLDDNTIQINSAPGQPKTAVGGNYGAMPDLHCVDRTGPELTVKFTPGNTESVFQLRENTGGDGFREEAVSAGQVTGISLSDAHIRELTGYIKVLENRLLCPVDVEFGIDHQGKLFILQVRPVTRLPGAMRFNAAPDASPMISGAVVSEGFCSGTLYQAEGPGIPLQKDNIVLANHFHEGMLGSDFLDKAGGFIFKQGGLNDHVAISLRQAGKPYFIAGDSFQWPERETTSRQYTLACGHFNGELKGGLWQGDHVETLRRGMTSSSDHTMPVPLNRNTPATCADFKDPGKGFEWLNRQNARLLKYFAPEGVFARCLEPKSVVSVSMSGKRQSLMTVLEEETSHFLQDTQALLEGYQQLLAPGGPSGENNRKLQQKKTELQTIAAQFNRLSTQAQGILKAITRPFASGQELPDPATDFEVWQDQCRQLRNCLQQLSQPRTAEGIRSFHDIVFFIHKAFIQALPLVSESSGMGVIKKIKKNVILIDFAPDDEKSLLSNSLMDAFKNMDCTEATLVHTKSALIISASLGAHQCVIESLANGDGGKGAMVRIKFSDDMHRGDNDNRRQRILLATLFLEAISENSLSKQINPSASELIIENTHLPEPKTREDALLKAIRVIFSLRHLNTDFEENQAYRQHLSLPAMMRRIKGGLQLPENELLLKYFLVNRTKFTDSAKYTERLPFNQCMGYKAFCELGSIANKPALLSAWMQGQHKTIQREGLLYLLSGDPRIMMKRIKTDFSQYYNADFFKKALSLDTRVMDYIPQDMPGYDDCVTHALKSGRINMKKLPPYLLDDTAVLTSAVKQDGLALQYAPEELKADKAVVMAAVKQNVWALQYASEKLKADKEMVMTAVQRDGLALGHASEELRADKEIVMAAIQQNGLALQYVSDALKEDREIVRAAVQEDGWALQFAHKKWQADKEVIMAVLQSHGMALQYAPKKLQEDKEFVRTAVQEDGWALQYASEKLRTDREIVMAAVQRHGRALEYTSEVLKTDRAVVMAAVQKHGWALQYASDILKADKEIVMVAVQQNGMVLQYASEALKTDWTIVIAAVQKYGCALQYASEKLRADRAIVMAAVQQNGLALEYASEVLKTDRAVVMAAVQQNGLALEYASEALKTDRAVVMTAVQQNGLALQYASEALKTDRAVVMAAVQQNGLALEYASEVLKTDRAVVMAAVQQNGLALEYASEALKKDKEVVMAAVQENGGALQYAPDELKADKEIVIDAVQQDGSALQYAHKNLQKDRDVIWAAIT